MRAEALDHAKGLPAAPSASLVDASPYDSGCFTDPGRLPPICFVTYDGDVAGGSAENGARGCRHGPCQYGFHHPRRSSTAS